MIKGTIKTIHELTNFESKGGDQFTKQIFTVANNEGYENKEQLFAFELFGDKTSLLNGKKEGDTVDVEYNISCRHWKEDRYFVSLQAWKIEGVGAGQPLPTVGTPPPDGDDLPF